MSASAVPANPAADKVYVRVIAKCATIIDAVVFFSLLVVIVCVVVPYGTVDPWWESAFECAVFAITALWIVEGLCRGSWQVRKLYIVIPLILMTVYAFGQTLGLPPAWVAKGGGPVAQHTLTIDRYQTYLTARKLLALILFLSLLITHTTSDRRFRWLVRLIIGVGLASGIFALLRQQLQSADSTEGFVLPFLYYGVGYGQFLSANDFSYLMEMTLGLVAGLVAGGGVRYDRLPIYLAIMAIVWAALVLTASRGGLLSLICASVFVLFVSTNWYFTRRAGHDEKTLPKVNQFMRKTLWIRATFVVLIVITLSAGVLWMGSDKLASKLTKEASDTSQSTDGLTRREIWSSTWKLIKQNPWTGIGFGTYFLGIPQYQISSGRIKVEEAHNEYLDLAANGGLIAVVLGGWFVWLVIRAARTAFRSRNPYQRGACLGAAAGILGVAVHSLVDFGLQLTGIAVFLATIIAILVVTIDRINPAVKERRLDLQRSARS